MKEFLKQDVVRTLGIPSRTVQLYVDLGLIIPEIANPSGRGARRKFSRNNLFQFLLIKELQKKGLTLERIRQVLALNKISYGKYGPDPKIYPRVLLVIYDFDQNPQVIFYTYPPLATITKTYREKLENLAHIQGASPSDIDRELESIDWESGAKKIQKGLLDSNFSISMQGHDTAMVINITSIYEKLMETLNV